MADVHIGFGTPWQAQIDFLLAKLRLPTERWDDIQKSAHDRAFIVAGAAKADLLADLQQAVADNASKGTAAFAKDFKAIVAKHGWTGWTGEGTPEGEAWRARVIYQTNMSTSYAAARYQQLKSPAFLVGTPYWRYIHSDSVMHPRPHHLAWHGLTLPHDHPFWNTHFAPNGWGCQCRITGVSQQQGEASARAGLGEPPQGWKTTDPKTGAPVGIDKGFDYAPGASVGKSLQSFVAKKLIKLDAGTGAQMWQALGPPLRAETEPTLAAMVDSVAATMQAAGETVLVGAVDTATVLALRQLNIELENAAIWLRDHEVLHGLRHTKDARGASLDAEVFKALPGKLETAEIYLGLKNEALVFVFDLGEHLGKVPVKLNYNEKTRLDGERAKIISNFVRTGAQIDLADMDNPVLFKRLHVRGAGGVGFEPNNSDRGP